MPEHLYGTAFKTWYDKELAVPLKTHSQLLEDFEATFTQQDACGHSMNAAIALLFHMIQHAGQRKSTGKGHVRWFATLAKFQADGKLEALSKRVNTAYPSCAT